MTVFLDIRPRTRVSFGSRSVIAGGRRPIIASEGREVVNAKARSMLAALTALLAAASAEPGGDPAPSASCPARAAAPLVYVYVPGSLGAATWAERQMEAVRLGIGTPARGEASASAVSALFSLHGPPAPGESGVEPTEAPREKPVQASSELPEPPKDASEEARILDDSIARAREYASGAVPKPPASKKGN